MAVTEKVVAPFREDPAVVGSRDADRPAVEMGGLRSRKIPLSEVREQLARVLHGLEPGAFVRDAIVSSWRRSMAAGLDPRHLTVPYESSSDVPSELWRTARPVTDRLAADLAGTSMSVLLSDAEGRIVHRYTPGDRQRHTLDQLELAPGFLWSEPAVGTTSIGLAATLQWPVLVDGGEHFMEALIDVGDASATVTNPVTGEVIGALTIVTDTSSVNALMPPVVRRTAEAIEHRLLDGRSVRMRLLHEHFLHARRRSRSALVVVGEQMLLMNAAASRLLKNERGNELWQFAMHALEPADQRIAPFTTATGVSLTACVEAIRDGGELVGAIVRLSPTAEDDSPKSAPANRGRAVDGSRYGWDSLTEPERYLAELVSEGLTNREAAARLFLSHHTVDSHIRHIFRKLDINSRVALARLVTEREKITASLPAPR